FARRVPPADPDPLSLHDALPISRRLSKAGVRTPLQFLRASVEQLGLARMHAEVAQFWLQRLRGFEGGGFESAAIAGARTAPPRRSEEHTSELQSRGHLVCRLLLE